MNILTGGGTLVHEIVHPFVAANFPACPAWLNEGMGSLYEQCGQRGGKIVGFTNWRLTGLQKRIQSRYLLYSLQQKGLLRKFSTVLGF